MIYHSGTENSDIDSGNMIIDYASSLTLEDGLYWYTIPGELSGQTFIIDSSYNGAALKNIHNKGLIKINGVIYLINDVSEKNITLSESLPGSATEAKFAVCG